MRRRVRAGLEPVVLSRDAAFIGVLVDDLVTAGWTSRTDCSRHGPSSGCCCVRTMRYAGCFQWLNVLDC